MSGAVESLTLLRLLCLSVCFLGSFSPVTLYVLLLDVGGGNRSQCPAGKGLPTFLL